MHFMKKKLYQLLCQLFIKIIIFKRSDIINKRLHIRSDKELIIAETNYLEQWHSTYDFSIKFRQAEAQTENQFPQMLNFWSNFT